MFFLRESFKDIYSKNPMLIARDLIMVDSIWSNENKLKRFYNYLCESKDIISSSDIKFSNIYWNK